MTLLDSVKQYFSRLILWRLQETVKVSDKELNSLNAHYSPSSSTTGSGTKEENDEEKDAPSNAAPTDTEDKNSDGLKSADESLLPFYKLLVWRTSNLQFVLFLQLVLVILESIKTHNTFDYYSEIEKDVEEALNLLDRDYTFLSDMGIFSIISSKILPLVILVIGVVLCIITRRNLVVSSRILRWFFFAAMIIKLLPTIFQIDRKLNFDEALDRGDVGKAAANTYIAALRVQFTMKNAVEIIPLIVAFPRGAIAGAMAMFGLKPNAITPKVLLMYFYPFATMLLILGCSSVSQMAGDPFLATALLCFLASDIIMYFSYKHVLSGDSLTLAVGWMAKTRLILKVISWILLFSWVLWKFIPCLDPLSYYTQRSSYYPYYTQTVAYYKDAHCQVFTSVGLVMDQVFGLIVRLLYNLFIAKIIFVDVIALTMEYCEPDESGSPGFVTLLVKKRDDDPDIAGNETTTLRAKNKSKKDAGK